MKRRKFIQSTSAAGIAAAATTTPHSLFAEAAEKHNATIPKGKAEACIFMWLGGGVAQTDTWDPKKLGDPAERVAGSAYPAIDTAVPGVQVCEHLPEVAKRLDRMTILRSVNHDVIDEHAAAVNRMHTGRPVSGTVVYPSVGSIIAHERGAAQDGVPAYVLEGYPSVSRGPGFLGAKHSYLYVTDTKNGPAGLARPPGTDTDRQLRRQKLLGLVRNSVRENIPENDPLLDYDAVIEESQKLASGDFSKVFNLDSESADVRNSYGGEFGQRCLLARRLVQQGVRFVEVLHNLTFTNGTGWDTHNDGQLKQHLLIQEVDQALSALIDDLERNKMLDTTLISISSEFGRPAEFDSGGGRGHQGTAFSTVLAGGGLNHKGAIGQTDELAKKVVERPVSVADFHATIHHALGIDYEKMLYDGDRPVPITDRGTAVRELFV